MGVQSDIVLVDLKTGLRAFQHRQIGTHAHGLVIWGDMLLTLDSAHSALVSIKSKTGQKRLLWQVRCSHSTVNTCAFSYLPFSNVFVLCNYCDGAG